MAKKELLLKTASLSPLVLSEMASTSNVLDVSITAENASERSPNPECLTLRPGSKSTCGRADERVSESSIACRLTISSQFAQSLSSERTPLQVRKENCTTCRCEQSCFFGSIKSLPPEVGKKRLLLRFCHEVKEIRWKGQSAAFFSAVKITLNWLKCFISRSNNLRPS